MRLGKWLSDRLIAHAIRHPYEHIQHDDGKPYMDRYWLLKPRAWMPLSIRIHHILSSDRGRDMHDHPWSSVSHILRGGYWELMPDQVAWRGEGDWVSRAALDRHRLLVPKKTSCWSLFVMFGKQREWGFYTRHGWIDRAAYLANPARSHTQGSHVEC